MAEAGKDGAVPPSPLESLRIWSHSRPRCSFQRSSCSLLMLVFRAYRCVIGPCVAAPRILLPSAAERVWLVSVAEQRQQ